MHQIHLKTVERRKVIKMNVKKGPLSERLKELRLSKGYSLQELADRSNTSKSAINMYERGERHPKYEALVSMASAFDVDVDYLLGKADDQQRKGKKAEFYQRLREAMAICGITQSELTRLTGIPKSAISQYVSGAFAPRGDRLAAIAEVLGVSEPWLLGYEDYEKVESYSPNKLPRRKCIKFRMKEAMLLSNKKLIDVSLETGIAKGTISNYLHGKYEPKAEAVAKIAKVLGVSDMWLMGHDVPMCSKYEPPPRACDALERAKMDFFALDDDEKRRFVMEMANVMREAVADPEPQGYPRGVYVIQHIPTGKVYVGSSVNPDHRIKQHLLALRRGGHVVEDMQADYDRYGEDYSFTVIDSIASPSERHKEYDWMEKYGSYRRECGYNYKHRHLKTVL